MPGSRNKINDKMRADIMSVYRRLGGVAWLLTWAKANETEFVSKVLSHVLPAPPRDEAPTVTINTGPLISADELTDMQAASRIAFALAQAAQQLEPGRVIEGATVPTPKPVKPPAKPAPPPPPPVAAPESTAEREVAHFGSGAEQGTRRRNLL
ncbi:hypothetical protein [Pseudogulbenkiania sp. NH8B]|uniref:hypothetical protein n=1 Tax=Pseudogulbenkiania sp. (strain NH8B) TaxID=748280 RepID=UPI0002D6FA2D|nr:hypothetical protein [Pseudogulbenkiania sp. NH8B]